MRSSRTGMASARRATATVRGRSARLRPGDPAPAIRASALDGRAVDLSAMRGRPVHLAFFRYASCPYCNMRVADLIRHQSDFQRSAVETIAVFQSPADRLETRIGAQAPPFAVVGDPEQALYRRYAVGRSIRGLVAHPVRHPLQMARTIARFLPGVPDGPVDRMPAEFLIGEDGRIEVAHYGVHLDDRLPIDAVLRWVAARRTELSG